MGVRRSDQSGECVCMTGVENTVVSLENKSRVPDQNGVSQA